MVINILAVLNTATVNTAAQTSVWISTFSSFEFIPSNGIAGSYVNSMFNVLRNHHTIFRSRCTCYIPTRDQISLHPCQYLFSVFLVASCCNGCEMYLTVLWFAFFWFLVILGIFPYDCWPFLYIFWTNVYLGLFIPFLIGLLVFLLLFRVHLLKLNKLPPTDL